jgi:hypothetical protein
MKKLVLFLCIPLCAQAQSDYTADVQSVDAILNSLYSVISGEPGAQRNWQRFQHLFAEDARLIPTRKNEAGAFHYQALSPGDYVELFQSRVSKGFYERELHRVTESFGTVTHVFSTYETRELQQGPVTNRGINSIQLFFDGTRYYILNIFWCAESMGFVLPEKYLK